MRLMKLCENLSAEGITSEVLVMKDGLKSFVVMRSDNGPLTAELIEETRGFMGSKNWLKKEVMKFAWEHIKDGDNVFLFDTEFREASDVEMLTTMLATNPEFYKKQIKELSKRQITREDVIAEIKKSGIKLKNHESFSNLINKVLSEK